MWYIFHTVSGRISYIHMCCGIRKEAVIVRYQAEFKTYMSIYVSEIAIGKAGHKLDSELHISSDCTGNRV